MGRTEVRRSVFLGERSKDFVHRRFANVHKHVCIGESLHGTLLISLAVENSNTVRSRLATIIFFQHLTIRHRRDAVVVELEPPSFAIRFNKCKVVTSMQIAGVDKHSSEFVYPGLGCVGTFVEEFAQIDREREFKAIINLLAV